MRMPIVTWLGLFVLLPAAHADDLTDAKQILVQADQSIRAVHSVRYHVTLVPDKSAAPFVAKAEGWVTLSGWGIGTTQSFRYDIRAQRLGSKNPINITVGGDGHQFFRANHNTKRAWRGSDRAVLGASGRTTSPVEMHEFVHPKPFRDELRARSHVLLEPRTIAGVPCYSVKIAYERRTEEAIWYFSKEDLLPRGVKRITKSLGGERRTWEVLVSKLTVNPTLKADAFTYEPPAGYTIR